MIKILIVGGTGQFGFYLAKFLLKKKNYSVYISTRKINTSKVTKFKYLLANRRIKYVTINVTNIHHVSAQLKKIQPKYIFYFAGQSSVYKSFKNAKLTFLSNYVGCENFLFSILKLKLDTKFFNASSSEIFGNLKKKITLLSKKNPVSPYGIAKLKSFNITKMYRKKFHLKSYNGVIFNCESILRPKNYLIPKICLSAINASKIPLNKNKKKFYFGNINIERDWGWCEEYVKIIWLNIKNDPHDFMIATGKSYTAKYLLDYAFSLFKLNWKDFINIDSNYFRRKEILSVKADSNYLKKNLNYLPSTNGKMIIKKMVKYYKSILI
jgi:GDPmannose 4,6-dehydratase